MRKPVLMVLLVSTLAGVLLLSRFPAAPSKEQPAAFPNAGRPKLVLIVVIDQFRYDYLERFRPYFVARGFNLLLGGASFVDCRYDYATTATCPGHATLLTGAYPNVHGIIANQWYDNRLGRQVYCAEDPDTKLVGGTVGPGFSPRNLLGSTLGDELRLATGFRSKVVAISLKDRASIIPGGHTANAAYWYDVGTGHFVTSTYYMAALPSWAAAFNEQVPARTYCGKVWQALPETPEAGGAVLKRFSPTTQETCPGKQFLTWLDATPFMTQMELNFALEAIKRERLGQGAATDLLTVSLSENDYIGHAFGPYSPQVADMTLQTDRYLADFFKALDRLVGLEHVWIALSSDHGAAPGPAFTVAHRLGGPNAEPPAIRQAVEQALSRAFGQGPWVQDLEESYISLNRSTVEKDKADLGKAEEVAAEAVASVPGVLVAFTRTALSQGPLPDSPLARKASHSFNPKRSGDVFLIYDPYVSPTPATPGTVSSHSAPWNYDSQVPLVLWGEAFKPGAYAVPCEPTDLAPTLAVALGLTQPSGAQGHPLTVALK